jgi:hypothetical protein
MPTAVALSSLKIAFVRLAMRRASVVLPQLRPVQFAVSPAHHTGLAWWGSKRSALTLVDPIE